MRNADGPVAGVRITATGEGFSGEATTAENGTWSIGVPVQGTYQVKVDVSTFPEGVKLAAGTPNPREVTFSNTSNAAAVFPLGEGIVVQSASFGEIFVERLIAGLSFGLLLALASVGLSLIFGTTGLTNFAHGEMVTLGAVAGVRLLRCGPSDLVGAALGCHLRRRPSAGSRTRGSGSRCGAGVPALVPMMIVSIGLALAVRYIILFYFGGATQQLPGAQSAEILELGQISISRNNADLPGRQRWW